MPNWCHNSMEIVGPVDEITRFKQVCLAVHGDETVLDFDAIKPMPGIFEDDPGQIFVPDPVTPENRKRVEKQKAFEAQALEATGFAHAHEWACEHWGANRRPWGFEVIRDEPNSYECYFVTAEIPPVGILKKLGEMFPTLEFSLRGFDLGNDWGFRGRIRDGKLELREAPLIWESVDPKTGEKTASAPMQEVGSLENLSFEVAPVEFTVT